MRRRGVRDARTTDRGLVYQQEPVSADAGDCFARHGVTELTIELATGRTSVSVESSWSRTIAFAADATPVSLASADAVSSD